MSKYDVVVKGLFIIVFITRVWIIM